MTIRPCYAAATIALLAVETAIALFVHEHVVRPFIGDGLAVILVYCALRAVTPLVAWTAIATALATACAIELGQRIGVLDLLGLRASPVAAVLLGTGFDPLDLIAYTAGALSIAAVDSIPSFRMQQGGE